VSGRAWGCANSSSDSWWVQVPSHAPPCSVGWPSYVPPVAPGRSNWVGWRLVHEPLHPTAIAVAAAVAVAPGRRGGQG
jgi:hypothetical protein